jgi:hypothetical protein
MSPEMFSALITARLRPLPAVQVQGGKGLELNLRVQNRDLKAHLERSYDQYLANPDALTPIIEAFIRSLMTGETDAPVGTQEFESVRARLLPRLVTARQWMDKRDAGLRLVVRPVAQDLGAALVVDHPGEFAFVELDSIPRWGVDAQTAYDTALANLERESAGVETRASGEGMETLLIDDAADGHASERALLFSRLKDWQARVEGELVLGMPTHGLLLGFSRGHPALKELGAQVRGDARSHRDGLEPNLLLVRNGMLELLG